MNTTLSSVLTTCVTCFQTSMFPQYNFQGLLHIHKYKVQYPVWQVMIFFFLVLQRLEKELL